MYTPALHRLVHPSMKNQHYLLSQEERRHVLMSILEPQDHDSLMFSQKKIPVVTSNRRLEIICSYGSQSCHDAHEISKKKVCKRYSDDLSQDGLQSVPKRTINVFANLIRGEPGKVLDSCVVMPLLFLGSRVGGRGG